MAKCTDTNVFGGIVAQAEMAGKQIEEAGFTQMTAAQKMGYANQSSKLHARGLKEDGGSAIREQMQKFRDMGLKQDGLGGHFRDPLVMFGDDIKPITDAAGEWKQAVLDNGLSQVEGRKLWNEKVRPVVEQQRQAVFQKDPEGYYKKMAQGYFDDMSNGVEVFGGDEAWHSKAFRKGAQYYTGYSPHIALYDVGELVTKGMTRFGPYHFTKGLATALWKSKGGILGRMDENKALYSGVDFARQKGKGHWLMEHINPQYYSNNLLVNGSAEMARSAGMDAAEGVRKVGFIKEIGNTPAYLRKGGAEITWARYSTEAAKFYIDIHADLGRAIARKDPKMFAGALGSVLTYHGVMTALAGAGSSLPAMPDKFLKAITNSEDEDDLFSQIDEDVAFSNILGKSTGVNARRGLQLGMPAYGLAFGAGMGLLGKPISNAPKIKEALENGDQGEAFKLTFEAAQGPVALFRSNPLLTKTFKNMAFDLWDDELEAEEKIELFTGKDSIAK